jgi:hypothetical protein
VKRGGPIQRHTPLGNTTPLARTPLKAVSDKRKAANRLRRKVVNALFPERPRCAVPNCVRLADDVHEPLTRGRGGSITSADNMAPLCRPHHTQITDEQPAWAYELGLLVHSWPGDAA